MSLPHNNFLLLHLCASNLRRERCCGELHGTWQQGLLNMPLLRKEASSSELGKRVQLTRVPHLALSELNKARNSSTQK